MSFQALPGLAAGPGTRAGAVFCRGWKATGFWENACDCARIRQRAN